MENNDTQLTRLIPPAQLANLINPYPATRGRELSLSDIWLKIWKRRLAAFIVATTIFGVIAVYTFVKKPVYESVAQIRVDASQQGGLGLEDLISQKLADSDAEGGRLATEMTILQSPPVSMQVIKKLDLAHKVEFAGKKLPGMVNTADPVEMDPKSRDQLLRAFHDAEKVEVLPKTRVIEIRFRNTNPKLASEVVNGIVEAYLQRNFQVKYQGTAQVSEWLAKQMGDLKIKAAESQQRLADFQKEHNIIGTDENNNIVVDRLRHLNQQLTDAEGDRIVKEARFRLASSGNPELVASVVPSTTLQALRMQEADLKAQYAVIDAKFGSGYPKVQEMQGQLKRLNEAITIEVANVGQRLQEEFLAAKSSEGLLRAELNAQKQEAFRLNESAVQFATLKHEVESTQELSDTLQLKLKEAGLVAGLASADISVVTPGMLPARPAFPKKGLMLPMGLLIGLFGGLVAVFILESVDDSMRTCEEVEQASAVPALATIPLVNRRILRNGEKSSSKGGFHGLGAVMARHPGSLMAEAYRVVCNSLLLASAGSPPKVLVVTSALPSEGKSVSSCNLAVALAQRGSRVLLVDADLRRSTLQRHLGLEPNETTGLSSMLTGHCEPEKVTQPFAQLPTLDLITAGPRTPCPAELLGSKKMKELLEQWSGKYDHVVIDTAPVLFFADTMPLAASADGVLLVVLAGRSRRRALNRMLDLLTRVQARVVGVIVNGVDLRLDYASSYITYGYYKGYGEANANEKN